jgi:glycosyltransferase involved in cell wall biosynthesis
VPPPLDWDARATRGRRAAHRVLPAGAVRPRNAPLRLLAGAHDLELAGAQIALATLLAALAAEGAAVSLASPRDGPLRERLEAAGVEVALVDGAALADPAAYAGDRDRLARVLAARRPDVVLANTLLAFPWVDAARRAGLPSLWWVHESWPGRIAWRYLLGETGLHPLVRRSAERALRSASALLFVARATQVLYEPWSDPLRHHTLPYGLDLAALRARGAALDRPAARAALGLDPGRPVVLSVGTVDPRKGQWLLLAALARLADRHPDAQLVLLGAHPSPYVDGVEQEAARLGVAERLRVVPPAPDPVPWYVAADLLALAADVESLPLTLIEALALEVPALATATFGTPDVVLDGETGWLVERRDVAALTRGLDAALSATAPERERRGRAGAALVTERHALAPFAREVTALLLGLAGRRSVAVAAAPAQPVAGAVGAP